MGFGPLRRLVSVELPIAVPVIAAGLRVATVSNVSLVAVAGTIGVDNLGQLFDHGLPAVDADPYYPPIVLGHHPVRAAGARRSTLLIVLGATGSLTPWRRAVAGR